MTTHDKIKTQIVAFLFNSRADVLRGEMFRALCLHVLNEIDTPCDLEQLTDLVGYAIDASVRKSTGLQTVISDEVTTLVKEGKVVFKDGLYSLDKLEKNPLPDNQEEKELRKVLLEEITNIARSINPDISKAHINKLFDFYIAVCDIVAKERMLKMAQAGKINLNYTDFGELSETIEKVKIEYDINNITNSEKFIDQCFIQQNEILSNYAFTLIQVNVIMQLLTWDPSLEYIRENILKGKTLYLDTSILFPLMLNSAPTHDFINSLIIASIQELGVNIKVHDDTLKEYDSVIKGREAQFTDRKLDLKQLAMIAKKENVSPRDILDDDIFSDYLSVSLDHVDPGSWQRYTNDIGVDSLKQRLTKLGVSIDRQYMFVPNEEFYKIQANMKRASVEHSRRNKRSTSKTDVTHDSRLYYLLYKIRQQSSAKLSIGFNTYLLTMDGSLIPFTQLQGIPWSETYFLYPNQWYELAFPFLRVKISENPLIPKNFASMAFSNVFTKLENLIPLQIFGYVFSGGGVDLSLKSVQSVIEALYEQRLVERLDPSNKNITDREEAKLKLQRMIAEKMIEENEQIGQLVQKGKLLRQENKSLDSVLYKKHDDIKKLEDEALHKEIEISRIEEQILNKRNIADIQSSTEDLRKRLESDQQRQIDEITSYYNKELERSEEESQRQRELNEINQQELYELRSNVTGIRAILEKSQEEKEKEEVRRIRLADRLKKIIVTAFMLFGILLAIILLNQISASIGVVIISVFFMVFGITSYHAIKNLWWSFISFSFGILLTSGVLLSFYKLETFLWIIPMAWEVLLIFVERVFKGQDNSSATDST